MIRFHLKCDQNHQFESWFQSGAAFDKLVAGKHVSCTICGSSVGTAFAKEARDMHDGLVPDRPIYGEANLAEARKLAEDGIPVMPLPFIPAKKAH
jgi:hypothetical protein